MIYVALLLAFGACNVLLALTEWRNLRRMSQSSRSKTRSAPQGQVELEGYLWPLGPTVKNSSGEDCAFLDLTVTRKNLLGGKSTTLYSGTHSQPFYLADETGAVEIFPPEIMQRETKAQHGVASLMGWMYFPVFWPILFFVLTFRLATAPLRLLYKATPFARARESLRNEGYQVEGAVNRPWLCLSRAQKNHIDQIIFGGSDRSVLRYARELVSPLWVKERSMPAGAPIHVNGHFSSPAESVRQIDNLGPDGPAKCYGRITKHHHHFFWVLNAFENDYILRRRKVIVAQLVMGIFSIWLSQTVGSSIIRPPERIAAGSLLKSEGTRREPWLHFGPAGHLTWDMSQIALDRPLSKDARFFWKFLVNQSSLVFLNTDNLTPELLLPNVRSVSNGEGIGVHRHTLQADFFVGVENNPDGREFVVVWDARRKRVRHRIPSENVRVAALFGADAKPGLAMLSSRNAHAIEFEIWNLADGVRVHQQLLDDNAKPEIYQDPTGRRAVLFDGAKLWILSDPGQKFVEARRIEVAHGKPLIAAAIDETGEKLAVGFGNEIRNGRTEVYNLADLQLITAIESKEHTTFIPIRFLPGSLQLLVRDINGRMVSLLDSERKTWSASVNLGGKRDERIRTFATSDNGAWMVAVREHGPVIWDLRRLSTAEINISSRRVRSKVDLGISDDGRWLAINDDLYDVPNRKAYIGEWDLSAAHKALQTLPRNATPRDCLTFRQACQVASEIYERQANTRGESAWLLGACAASELGACKKLIMNKEKLGLSALDLQFANSQLCRMRAHDCVPPLRVPAAGSTSYSD